jgi:hypothetical protein
MNANSNIIINQVVKEMLLIYAQTEDVVVVEPVVPDKLGKIDLESDFTEAAERELTLIGLKVSETVALLIYYNIVGIKMHLFNVLNNK